MADVRRFVGSIHKHGPPGARAVVYLFGFSKALKSEMGTYQNTEIVDIVVAFFLVLMVIITH